MIKNDLVTVYHEFAKIKLNKIGPKVLLRTQQFRRLAATLLSRPAPPPRHTLTSTGISVLGFLFRYLPLLLWAMGILYRQCEHTPKHTRTHHPQPTHCRTYVHTHSNTPRTFRRTTTRPNYKVWWQSLHSSHATYLSTNTENLEKSYWTNMYLRTSKHHCRGFYRIPNLA